MVKQTISTLLLLCFGYASIAQDSQFKYKRKLSGVDAQWHQVVLPNEVFEKVNSDFSDLRILGIKDNGDTVEAPYVLRIAADEYKSKKVEFKLINKVHNGQGYYYTFEVPVSNPVNQIDLKFSLGNFDWRVDLEGSQDQKEWFTIVNNSRIVSVDNKHSHYQYTTLYFDDAVYKYFRLRVPEFVNPGFEKAVLYNNTLVRGENTFPVIASQEVTQNKQSKQTEINVTLKEFQPISYLKINIDDTLDYYRTVSIAYVRDSFETVDGWKYDYGNLMQGRISSFEKNEFRFPNRPLKRLRVRIDNNDNEPLSVANVELHGNPYKLYCRFTIPATYYLVYGNQPAAVPQYDITRFTNYIPENPTQITVGEEELWFKDHSTVPSELFQNNLWLWAILFVIIVVLGWFSLKMIRA